MLSDLIQKVKALLSGDLHSCSQVGAGHHRRINFHPMALEVEDEGAIALKMEELKGTVYDYVRNIRDPEKPATLEDLQVVYESGIEVTRDETNSGFVITVEFNPTVPHCSLATMIGLCIKVKIERNLTEKFKLDIFVKKGSHDTESEINKQINDKERVAAAIENPTLLDMVESCISDYE